MAMDNRSLVKKADLAIQDLINDGGFLEPAQAKRFIRVLINEAKLLKMVTMVPMRSDKQKIEKIRFAGRVLKPGSESQALPVADRSKPDLTKETLDAELFKAEVRLSNETLEDSIEGGTLRNTIMQELGKAVSRDMEFVTIQGDTTSADSLLAVLDGVIKQATVNIVPAGGSLVKTVLRDVIKAMPTEFLRNKRIMKFLTSADAQTDYSESLSSRETALGDRFFMEDVPPAFNGIPVVDIAEFPEDLGGANTTALLFTDAKNIHVGIRRNIQIETDKDISAGVVVIVATLRMDVKFAVKEAVVKATGVTTA